MSDVPRANLRERIDAGVMRLAARLPAPALRALNGSAVRIDGQQLSGEMQLALRLLELGGGHVFVGLTPAHARARTRRDARAVAGRQIAVGRVSDLEIPGPTGSIPARLYLPVDPLSAAPLVVYFHGGGHVVGDLDTHDQTCRYLAREIPARVLAVDYRLGPENRFPGAVDDALAAFDYARAEAAKLGADPDRIAVAGDSAGGNLAAVVAQCTRDRGGPSPAFQVLIYPVTDYSKVRNSRRLFGEGFLLTARQMDWYRDNYLATVADRRDPRVSPLLAEDLSELAPAHIVTAGFDPLRDEGEAYAHALERAGVKVTLRRETDLVHGFVNAVGLGGRVEEAVSEIAAAFRVALGAIPPGSG